MKTKIGILFMVAGAVLIFAALGLFQYNQQQQELAGEHVEQLLPQMVDTILERAETLPEQLPVEQLISAPGPVKQMTQTEIDGHSYIGFLSMPALELELPVMAQWSYPDLQIAPCYYSGNLYTDDLVVMAHNYPKHFGKLSELRFGDIVTFTTMDAETVEYQVVTLDILAPSDTAEMTSGDYDLTLFTCTYGGKSRVTVRCNRIIE